MIRVTNWEVKDFVAATAYSLPQLIYTPVWTACANIEPTVFITPIEKSPLAFALSKATFTSKVSPD